MSNLQVQNFNLQTLTKENKFKKLKEKFKKLDTLINKRKQSEDLIHNKNKSENRNAKSYYNIKNNSYEDKDDFYRTFNILKKNLKEKNRDINNLVLEKKNRKYYIYQNHPNYFKNLNNNNTVNYHYCPYCKNCLNPNDKIIYNYGKYEQELIYELEKNDQIKDSKSYNNIRHHSINLSKNNKNNFSPSYNAFISNPKINTKINDYNYINKKEFESSPINDNNQKFFLINNPNEFSPDKYNKNNLKSYTKISRQNYFISPIKSKEATEFNADKINSDNDYYYEGLDNHRFYDSNQKLDLGNYYYDSNPIKSNFSNINVKHRLINKNLSEPKNVYTIKAIKISQNNEFNRNNDQMKEISPIRNYNRYDYEDNNDDIQNIERISESQSVNIYSINNSNSKLKNNIRIPNNIASSSLSTQVIKDTGNTKTVNIVYKSQNFPINNKNDNNNVKETKEINQAFNGNKNLESMNIKKLNEENIKSKVKDNNKNNLIETKNKSNMFQSSQNENKNPTSENKNKIIENNKSEQTNSNETPIKIENNVNKINANDIQRDNDNNGPKSNNDNKVDNKNNVISSVKMDEKNKNNNIINDDYPKIVDQEQNFEIIKEKYEFYSKKNEENEPDIKVNSIPSNKEGSNPNKNNIVLINSIKDKIKLLKSYKRNDDDNEMNYINEIDDYLYKIREKEEMNDLALKNFYLELFQRENENLNYLKPENQDNNINDCNMICNKSMHTEKGFNDENKKIIIKSTRIQNMMKQILKNKKYNLFRYKNRGLYNQFNQSKTYHSSHNNKNNEINESNTNNKAPDIHLIVDEENMKIMNENEYTKLRKKSSRSPRPINLMNKPLSKDLNIRRSCGNRFDLYGNNNYANKELNLNGRLTNKVEYNRIIYSPRIPLNDISDEIMPPNEI